MFRTEAIAHQQDRFIGKALVVKRPSFRFLVASVCLIPVAVVCFGVWGQYTRKEHVGGYLAPTTGLVKVMTPQAGTVVQAPVTEGQSVRQGDVLLVLTSERNSATTRDSQAAMQREVLQRRDSLKQELIKQAEIDSLSGMAVAQRMRGLEGQLVQAHDQAALQRNRVASAERTVQRNEALVASNFISEAGLQQKQEELMDQRSQLANLLRSITALNSDLAAARMELASSALRDGHSGE